MYYDKEKVKISSMTYNSCTNKIEDAFGISIDKSINPSDRFNLAITRVKGLINNKGKGQASNNNRELDDFSRNELRAVFRAIAVYVLKRSAQRNKKVRLSRMSFIKLICGYLQTIKVRFFMMAPIQNQ